MRKGIEFSAQAVRRPVIVVAIATLVAVGAFVFAATYMPNTAEAYRGMQVERVMPAPKLELHVPKAMVMAPAPTPPGVDESVQIARVGSLSLYAGNVEAVVHSLSRIAHGEGGNVFSLDVENEGGRRADAQMQMRVPASRFDAAMAAVARTGKVRQHSITAQDLTGNITDSAARLRNLRRTERDILQIMDRSGSIGQVLDAENQLSSVRERIERLESALKSMRARVVYSTINIDVEQEFSNAPVEPTAAAQIAGTWRSALHALVTTTLVVIGWMLWLVVFLPYAITVAVVWLLYTRIRRPRTG